MFVGAALMWPPWAGENFPTGHAPTQGGHTGPPLRIPTREHLPERRLRAQRIERGNPEPPRLIAEAERLPDERKSRSSLPSHREDQCGLIDDVGVLRAPLEGAQGDVDRFAALPQIRQ